MADISGEWEQVLRALYAIFDRDFRQTGCDYQGLPVWWDRAKRDGSPYEEGFWHLITQTDQRAKERLFDPRRAERLPWCRPVIYYACLEGILAWRYEEGSRQVRTYVWLKNGDYVVVLGERTLRDRTHAYFLVTAFYVDSDKMRQRLQRKYRERVT